MDWIKPFFELIGISEKSFGMSSETIGALIGAAIGSTIGVIGIVVNDLLASNRAKRKGKNAALNSLNAVILQISLLLRRGNELSLDDIEKKRDELISLMPDAAKSYYSFEIIKLYDQFDEILINRSNSNITDTIYNEYINEFVDSIFKKD